MLSPFSSSSRSAWYQALPTLLPGHRLETVEFKDPDLISQGTASDSVDPSAKPSCGAEKMARRQKWRGGLVQIRLEAWPPSPSLLLLSFSSPNSSRPSTQSLSCVRHLMHSFSNFHSVLIKVGVNVAAFYR